MSEQLTVLVAGRQQTVIETVSSHVSSRDEWSVQTRLIGNGHSDPLHGSTQQPDLLILCVETDSSEELRSLVRRPPAERPTILVIGGGDHRENMRLAMQAGARDFLIEPIAEQDLNDALLRIANDIASDRRGAGVARLTSFVGAGGGVGTTFLATNYAHTLVSVSDFNAALIDLDFLYASIEQALNLQPRYTVAQALEAVHEIDVVALDAYLVRHGSGLRVATGGSEFRLPQDQPDYDLDAFLDLVGRYHDHVVFDVPSRLDGIGASALVRSEQIGLVLQQDIRSLHNGARLFEILTKDLGISRRVIQLVVNRYNKDVQIELGDIKRSFGDIPIHLIPSDYKLAAESANVGVPVREINANAKNLPGDSRHGSGLGRTKN